MWQRARFSITGAVAGLAVLAVGCGDSTPSSAAFTKRVTSICAASQQRHDEAAKGFDFEAFNPDTSDLS